MTSDPSLWCSVNTILSGSRTLTRTRILGECKCKCALIQLNTECYDSKLHYKLHFHNLSMLYLSTNLCGNLAICCIYVYLSPLGWQISITWFHCFCCLARSVIMKHYSLCVWRPLTHSDWNKMAAILQQTFSDKFSCLKIVALLVKFHWNLFLKVTLTISQHRFRQWLGANQVTSHFCTYDGLLNWHIYVPLSLNELIHERQPSSSYK